MHIALRVLIGLILVTCLGCQVGPVNGGDPVYRSKAGNFTCKVPALVRPGERMQEGGDAGHAWVAFSDDFATRLQIDSEKLTGELTKAALTGDHAPEAIDRFFDAIVMPRFNRESSANKVHHREQVRTVAGPALFVVVELPRAADVGQQGAATNKPVSSVRGMLILPHGDWLYLISTEESFLSQVVPEPLPISQRCKFLFDDLNTTVNGMVFL